MHQPLFQHIHNVFLFFGSLFNQSAHAHTHTHMQGTFEVFVVLIVPSCHISWQSAEGALFWELDVILFWNAIHMEIFRRVLKKRSVFKARGVYQRGAFVWQSPQTVQSKEVFIKRRCST